MAWQAIVGGAALGAAAQYFGQERANEQNAASAKYATDMNMLDAARNRDFQAGQARDQMAFQERMANTARTREVQDLKNAGLNPILAAGGNGAPAPSGAAASGAQGSAQASTYGNSLSHISSVVTSAFDAAQTLQNIEKTQAETENAKANNALIRAQTKKTGVDTEVSKKDIPAAELKNDIYDLVRPAVKKIKGFFGNSAKEQDRNKMPETQKAYKRSIERSKKPVHKFQLQKGLP